MHSKISATVPNLSAFNNRVIRFLRVEYSVTRVLRQRMMLCEYGTALARRKHSLRSRHAERAASKRL